ncbi:hydrogenase accessory protein HypB [Caldicellulosiruptor acetigenus I77R1B]|uniref:Hydrogenase accessory protein HypB n=1 Tax=Caldicellulosiruptor acetigenus (strain ATCC 700853 / DSM 12137 / I77R1B) TaxID=632335 RepID=E4S643_CALA7|nr:hydrogenase nickel incorporation protein HypB [Caldicellulosiruptor acetigenus]ADQ40586.1 hydrogenase accessory protein HypB [Caldicellulosiruptor acetigenus I77R1B]
MEIKVIKNILERNQNTANNIRRLADENKWYIVNVMGSPGAGKTSFIKCMIENFKDTFNIAVIEGDVASTIDAQQIANYGVKVLQINTGGACHLVADSIAEAIDSLALTPQTVVFIENIGNLICPSSFDLGENLRIVVSSAAEGDDKPYKYPIMFEKADVVVLSKIDIIDAIGFDMQRYKKGLEAIKDKDLKLFEVSFRTKEGVESLINYFYTLLDSYFKK